MFYLKCNLLVSVLGSFVTLVDHAKVLVAKGIRSSTTKTYTAAQRRYIDFCLKYALDPVPVSENTLLLYIAQLNLDGLKPSSVRVYLSAVRAMHVDEGHGNPLENCLRIRKALHGMDMEADPPKQKLPITYTLLSQIKRVVSVNYDGLVTWCAMTLAFFGCLRAAELTVGSKAFDPSHDLCISDVTFTRVSDSDCAVVFIKHSKTDKKNMGFRVYLACTGTPVCGYCAMLYMLKGRSQCGLGMSDLSPLFLYHDGPCLTRSAFQRSTKSALAQLGLDATKFSGHSYRSGSATTAAMCGLSDHEIKLLGHWSSSAYQRYIRAPDTLLASFSWQLARSNHTSRTPQLDMYCKNLFS